MKIDYRLYLVTDRTLTGETHFYEKVQQALKGGVTLLQVREKEVGSREFYDITCTLKKIAAPFGVPVIVNDRLDIALAADADGLHIGEGDLPVEVARKWLGNRKLLGYSAGSPSSAAYGERMGADYIGAGAVFPTDSKKDAGTAIGLKTLEEVVKSVGIPVVGIGGISAANLSQVKATGVAGVSLISAVLGHAEPEKAAKELTLQWTT
ncbi:thiamine phosphate synthase [Anoxynatronum buryatiense]|uniref:Thiamine-phosphate synthase n=1 Tax=Anoxynatronum buryatiense TaxID=489973 RepID=A0AA45WWX1_9CLOT|nr:thiamine phosphate synthase [Anoxynatronum buryatiense]SMP61762.1 thiamine-phosphate diphosphorylase [Anoxynatronum buryatiense]